MKANRRIDLCSRWDRGGLILYRTTVPATALNGGAVLDISEPVRDYAKVRDPCSVDYIDAQHVPQHIISSICHCFVQRRVRCCWLSRW